MKADKTAKSFPTYQILAFRPWDPAKTIDLWKKTTHFFTMRSEDSETAHLLGSGPVLRHNNACRTDEAFFLNGKLLAALLFLLADHLFFPFFRFGFEFDRQLKLFLWS